METTYTPFRHIEEALLELDEVPLLGGEAPDFPYHEVAADLAHRLGLTNLQIEPRPPEWRGASETMAGIGDPLQPLRLVCSPLDVPFAWVMTGPDLEALMSALLGGDEHAAALQDPALCNGFYRFAALEVIHTAQRFGFPPGLSLQLLEEEASLDGPSLTIDIRATADNMTLQGRLILPEAFCRAWRTHHTTAHPHLSPELRKSLEVTLGAHVGYASLTPEEWASIKPGDFMALDEGMPEGEVALTIEGKTLFRGRQTAEGIEIQPPEGYHE